MKINTKLRFDFFVTVFCFLLSCSFACVSTKAEKEIVWENEPVSSSQNDLSNQANITPQTARDNSADVLIIRKYAEKYQPKSGKVAVIPSPPEPPEKVLQAIFNLVRDNSTEHEKYILLIFVRINRFHIENFKQSYELGRENPLTKEFYRIVKAKNVEKAEFMSSSLASSYAYDNKGLLEYPLIKKEIERLDKIVDKQTKEYEKEQKRRDSMP